jgi:hypothetical protein
VTSLPSSKPRPEAAVEDSAPPGPLRALLASIIDYAGLFPPASLDMPAAVRAYQRYRGGEHAWMLGTFVVPLARMDELAASATGPTAADPWPLSVLVPSLADVPSSFATSFDVRSLEVAPQEPDAIRLVGARTSEQVRVFYEVPLDDRMEARLDAVARAGAAAKVRTGGVTAAAFPGATRLAELVRGCAERGVAFKATAGLHHPRRGCYALTYEPRSPTANMYGFLDLALVAALLRSRRIDIAEAAELLSGGSAAVVPERDAVRWSGHVVSSAEMSALRSRLFLSFGSCSFEEPVADLTRTGLL